MIHAFNVTTPINVRVLDPPQTRISFPRSACSPTSPTIHVHESKPKAELLPGVLSSPWHKHLDHLFLTEYVLYVVLYGVPLPVILVTQDAGAEWKQRPDMRKFTATCYPM